MERHRRYSEEGERNTKKEKNTETERNTEDKMYTGEKRHTLGKSRSNNSKEGRQSEEADFQERRRQDDKVKCNVCGVVSENSRLYEEHLGSKMHKAFSMVIDLT